MKRLQVTVIGDSIAVPGESEFCEKLGRLLAAMDVIIITGGRTGVMEAVCKGAEESGGTTVGILPSGSKEDANRWCSVIIPTGLGHGRNFLTIMAADIVISVGGQAGTLTELGFAWLYNKPVLAIKSFGGWSGKMAGESLDNRRSDKMIPIQSMEELKEKLVSLSKQLGYNLSGAQ